MKQILTCILSVFTLLNLNGQDCGNFEFFNFKDTIVDDGLFFNQAKPGFYFEMTYDTLKKANTGYTSFFFEDENGDTITNPKYYRHGMFFPWNAGDTLGYNMVLDSGLSSFPKNFNGYLVTENPQCRIAYSNIGVKTPKIVKNNSVYIYPNPAKTEVFISNNAASLSESFEVKIFSIEGKLVFSELVNSNSSINLNGIKKGVYYLQTPFKNEFKKLIISGE